MITLTSAARVAKHQVRNTLTLLSGRPLITPSLGSLDPGSGRCGLKEVERMSRKRNTPEQIIEMLREAEVLFSQGQTTGEVCRLLGISEQVQRRTPEHGDLLYAEGGRSADREMAATVQPNQAQQRVELRLRVRSIRVSQTREPALCRTIHVEHLTCLNYSLGIGCRSVCHRSLNGMGQCVGRGFSCQFAAFISFDDLAQISHWRSNYRGIAL